MSNIRKAAGLSFKVAHPTTNALTEIAPYFTSITGDASADETVIYLFNPNALQPTAETIFGATNRTRSLQGYWSPAAETLFAALDGMQGRAYEEAPMGTALGNLKFVGACNFGAWSGNTGDANGQWAMSISLSLASRKVETIVTPPSTVVVTSSSVADPTVILTAAAHLLADGTVVTIAGHTGSTPSLNGSWPVTVLTSTTFSIPVSVSVAGTGGTIQD
jgi:hypothetical protein